MISIKYKNKYKNKKINKIIVIKNKLETLLKSKIKNF
jgi:hypothetical protein